MLSDNLALENPYLDVEAKIMKVLGENQAELTVVEGLIDSDNLENQLFSSFVVEKHALLGYVNDLISFAAKKQNISGFSDQPCKINSEREANISACRVCDILEKYQEQSNVLDSVLEQFVTPLMGFIKNWVRKTVSEQNFSVTTEVKAIFMVLSYMTKVRGYKTVVKFFPHEVSDMEPVTELLHFCDAREFQVPYILILWLSIIVLVPFDLTTIDSNAESQEILVRRLLNIGASYITNSGKVRDGASVMLGKLLTRPDVVKSGETDQFLAQLTTDYQQSVNETGTLIKCSGILQTLVEIFKTGHRDDLFTRVRLIFDCVLKQDITNSFMKKSSVIKKARVNLAQRIGCIFLKPKVAKWRYQRGSRSLASNLTGSSIITSSQTISTTKQEDEEIDDDLDDEQYEQLEFIIQYLLDGLKDDDNIVRWTSAKGIGRITMRLNQDFADQIVQQIYDLFNDSDSDSAWHGCCLALAELSRRGLLLPQRLASFIPILEKALIYDINLGTHSIGAHVRDAACYVVWSFSRAYAPEIMKPHVFSLSTKLIVVSLFDREVNIRRAASATFQEAVGRQGTFPHGIEILTEADYFTLSNRVNAYINVSCFVAQFPEYLESMLNHLAFVQLRHWEPQMRELASQALSMICVFNPKLVVDKILPALIKLCFDKTLNVRHGAVLGVSEILMGLSGKSGSHRKTVLERAFRTLSLKERNLIKEETENQKAFKLKYEEISNKNYMNDFLPFQSDQLNSVTTLVHQIEEQKLYKGKGGEIVRAAVCHLIYCLCQAEVKFTETQMIELFGTLKENLKHANIEIQQEATNALQSFFSSYFKNENSLTADSQFVKEILSLFKPSSTDDNIAVTRGLNMALGVLSDRLLKDKSLGIASQLINTLTSNCLPKGKESDDAETRKQAIKSIGQVMQSIGVENIEPNALNQIAETLFKALDDYALDRRGDVGSWVREEAMRTLTLFVQTLVQNQHYSQLVQALAMEEHMFIERYVSALLQQLAEKIDRVREVAGKQLQVFFKYTAAQVCSFAEKDALAALFLQQEELMIDSTPKDGGAYNTILHDEGIGYLPWRSADFVFAQIQPFFSSPVYSLSILKGLITSSGGLTESTMKASQKALFQYLSAMKSDISLKSEFLRKLVTIFEQNLKDDRISIPLMKTIEILLESGYLSEVGLAGDILLLHGLCVQEYNKSKAVVKLLAAIGVFANMLNFPHQELATKALRSLLSLLYHSFPKVRKIAAEKLYTSLLTLEDYSLVIPGGDEQAYELAQEMLSETDWQMPLPALTQSTRQLFYSYFGQQLKGAGQTTADDQQQIKT